MKSLIIKLFGIKENTPVVEGVPVYNLSPFNHYRDHLALAYLEVRKKYVGEMIPPEEVQRLKGQARIASGYSPRRLI